MWKLAIAIGLVVIAAVIGTSLLPSGEQETSVQDAFERACDAVQTATYDATITTTAPDFTSRGTMRVSGEDAHTIGTLFTLEGVRMGTAEWIVKDRVRYYREYTSDTPPSDGWRIEEGASHNIGPLSCASTDSVARHSSRDDGSGPQYTRTYSDPSTGVTITNDLWFDGQGFPARRRSTRVHEAAGGGMVTEEYVYTGFGEANIIEAPVSE